MTAFRRHPACPPLAGVREGSLEKFTLDVQAIPRGLGMTRLGTLY